MTPFNFYSACFPDESLVQLTSWQMEKLARIGDSDMSVSAFVGLGQLLTFKKENAASLPR